MKSGGANDTVCPMPGNLQTVSNDVKMTEHKRKLFCEISPLCYEISVIKGCLMRYWQDFSGKETFCNKRSGEILPVVIKKHKSLIRRKLGDVDMGLQENKAVNLALAAPAVSGILIRPGEREKPFLSGDWSAEPLQAAVSKRD